MSLDARVEQVEVVAAALGGDVEIRSFRRLSSGASRQTWLVEYVRHGREHVAVCQRERPGGARSATGLSGEAALLEDLAELGVPVAGVLAVDRRAEGVEDALGSWILLDHVVGETIPRRILDAYPDRSARSRLLAQFAAALAAVHRAPPDPRHGLEPVDQIGFYRSVLDALGDPRPTFELAFRWLAAHEPGRSDGAGAVAPRVVHGDFRLGNVIVADGELRAVLDWELAHLGDPVEDLAWCSLRAWRFSSELPVAGLGTVEEFLDAYHAAGGVPVDVASLRWWQVLGTLKWGIMCIVQAAAHQGGSSRSVELAAIGRRVAETEEDLLELIDGPHGYEPPFGAGPEEPGDAWAGLGGAGGPTVRPPAGVLLDAVGEFLLGVREDVGGRTGFLARVAGNVVDQVGRELRHGPVVVERHRARLDALGVADDAALASAIRGGDLDVDDRRLLDALRASVRDTLVVVHPGYWVPTRPDGD